MPWSPARPVRASPNCCGRWSPGSRSPTRRTRHFLLIDYKGGAAFGECARLPHTAGWSPISTPHLTRRALRSLDSELRRRERLFAAAGVADLDAYRVRGGRAAVARLVHRRRRVRDARRGAARLRRPGWSAVAQRGRSLGVHLVLATQRPGGARLGRDPRQHRPAHRAAGDRHRPSRATSSTAGRGRHRAALPGRGYRSDRRALVRSEAATAARSQTAADELGSATDAVDVRIARTMAPTRHARPDADLARSWSTSCARRRGRGRAARPHRPGCRRCRALLRCGDRPSRVGLVDLPDDPARRIPLVVDLDARGDAVLLAGAGRARAARRRCARSRAAAARRARSPRPAHLRHRLRRRRARMPVAAAAAHRHVRRPRRRRRRAIEPAAVGLAADGRADASAHHRPPAAAARRRLGRVRRAIDEHDHGAPPTAAAPLLRDARLGRSSTIAGGGRCWRLASRAAFDNADRCWRSDRSRRLRHWPGAAPARPAAMPPGRAVRAPRRRRVPDRAPRDAPPVADPMRVAAAGRARRASGRIRVGRCRDRADCTALPPAGRLRLGLGGDAGAPVARRPRSPAPAPCSSAGPRARAGRTAAPHPAGPRLRRPAAVVVAAPARSPLAPARAARAGVPAPRTGDRRHRRRSRRPAARRRRASVRRTPAGGPPAGWSASPACVRDRGRRPHATSVARATAGRSRHVRRPARGSCSARAASTANCSGSAAAGADAGPPGRGVLVRPTQPASAASRTAAPIPIQVAQTIPVRAATVSPCAGSGDRSARHERLLDRARRHPADQVPRSSRPCRWCPTPARRRRAAARRPRRSACR